MEFTKLLEERRSIRAFAPEKHVTAEQIQEIVQAAIQAPSWKNSQTTRYYALVTPEKVEEFSAKCLPEFNQKSSKGAVFYECCYDSIRKRPLRLHAGRNTGQ